MYLKEFNNNYTGFLRVICHNLLNNLLNRYGKITNADLKTNNQRMNQRIDLFLTIDKYYKRIDDCIEYANDGKTPFMTSQVFQKAYWVDLAFVIYVSAYK